MTLQFSSHQLQAMQAHAEHTYPEECCGLLLGTTTTTHKTLVKIRTVENSWDSAVADDLADSPCLTKTRRYWIAPEEMLAAMREARSQNLEIIGIYHSHPDHPAVPSECDRQLAWAQYSYVILSVIQGKATDAQSWKLDDQHQFQPEALHMDAQIDESPRMRRESLPTQP